MKNTSRTFKYTLEEIYTITNDLMIGIKNPEISNIQKELLIGELLKVTEELVLNNCKQFIQHNKLDKNEMPLEELTATANGLSLWKAIEEYSFESGTHFMTFWKVIMFRDLQNDFVKKMNKKNRFNDKEVCSSDLILNGEDNTILDYKADEKDMEEEICTKLVLADLLNKFEEIDALGGVIRCQLIVPQAERTKAIMKVMGVETYGSAERKAVERVKKRFAKFLIENNFDLTAYM